MISFPLFIKSMSLNKTLQRKDEGRAVPLVSFSIYAKSPESPITLLPRQLSNFLPCPSSPISICFGSCLASGWDGDLGRGDKITHPPYQGPSKGGSLLDSPVSSIIDNQPNQIPCYPSSSIGNLRRERERIEFHFPPALILVKMGPSFPSLGKFCQEAPS